jgi:signal transduction histidine kinase
VVGKHVGELLSDGGGDEVLALQREVLETGKPVRRTVTTRFPGERIVYDIFAEPLLDPAGQIVGIAAAACDITATIEIREQLDTAHEEMSRLWRQCAIACEAGRMGEWCWSATADRVSWSRAMFRVMARPEPASDVSTLSVDEMLHVIHPDDRQRLRSAARRALEDDRAFEIEVRVLDQTQNGPGVRWVEMRGQLERNSAGEPVEIVGIALDVTAHHLTEDVLARHNASLLRSNEDLEDFAYIVSHDLKEPLRGISNFARFVLEDDGPAMSEDGRNRLETIHRLTDRLAAQLDSLVQFSRVGRAEMGIEDRHLGDVATAAAQRLGPWLQERNATVTIEPGMPRTRCDGVRLEEVFVNLISNAVKYNDSQHKHVRIGAGPDGAIYVHDNGIGIPARNTSDIFQIFRRLHGRDAYEGGTGAGLAITRKIIERHAGRIWVESEPGRGSTFCFTLGLASSTNPVTTEPCAHTCCQS